MIAILGESSEFILIGISSYKKCSPSAKSRSLFSLRLGVWDI